MTKRDDDFTYDVTSDQTSRFEKSESNRTKIISISVTGVLVLAGLAGGAAFAISRLPQSSAPLVSSGSIESETTEISSDGPQSPSPEPTVAAAKTIVVPPAAFDDKGGARNFHKQPADGAAQASTSASATPAASTPPSFGGGEHEGEEKHRKGFGGVKPPHSHDEGHDEGGFTLPSPAPTN
jgi:hypothetical protein